MGSLLKVAGILLRMTLRFILGADLLHYKAELGPVNFQNLGDIQMNKEVNKLDDIETIDGNGQLYLALQDISMKNFTDELNKVESALTAICRQCHGNPCYYFRQQDLNQRKPVSGS